MIKADFIIIFTHGVNIGGIDEGLVWKFVSEQENFKNNIKRRLKRKKLTGEGWRENTLNASIL